MPLTLDKDIFGRMLLAHHQGHDGSHFIERSDGLLDEFPSGAYFGADWSEGEKQAMNLVRGRVLDVGCGAGRHSLRLQKQGHKVTAIDVSPLAIRVCRVRGVRDARILDIACLNRLPARSFDSVIMFGNNFGLVGTPFRARGIMKALHRITAPGAKIFAGSLNPHQTSNLLHLAYHGWNRAHNRPAGLTRLRVRFGTRVGPWIDWLHVSPAEMKKILGGTGWKMARRLGDKSPGYVAVLEKVSRDPA